ncbi:hypothetical protein [Geomonas propionica]|uniref:Uncharacterized protein n=1 Tax=Geomonas propionica TaxID=2798582 RepID=A0ABS0YXR8_9BACT|nr:hypothetical protein [Geomonas propionica]MBJ6802771.1 hypothetical protein [Geomonas propionica]
MAPKHSTRSFVAGERFFRLYHKHCVQPDQDTLFGLLEAAHSLNDRLNKRTGSNFFECNEFVALKALRNLFHHEEELKHDVRILSVEEMPPVTSDLLYLCLVPRQLVEKAIAQINRKRREQDASIIRITLKWYGNVVNINPCIFNFAVHVFEKFRLLGLDLNNEEYIEFRASYEYEEEHEHSHFATGDVVCHAGSAEQLLMSAFADVT